jgi:hypothetical protein
MNHRKLGILTAVALVLAVATQSPAHANLFANPGFEDPVTYDGPPFVGSWEAFNAGAGSGAGNAAEMPRNGALHLRLVIEGVDNSFAGVFQDVPVVAGQMMVFSGWHMTPSAPLDLGVEMRIEWRNSGSNTEVGRTPNLTVPPVGIYSQFSLSGTVPAGADLARVVYAVQTFGPEPTNNGVVFVDDVFFGSDATPSKATTWGRIKSLYK